MELATCRQGAHTTRDANYHESFKFSIRNPRSARWGSETGEGEVIEEQLGNRKVNCFECLHFFITHEPAHPHGCRIIGFKTRELPAFVVLRNSGAPCRMFERRGDEPGEVKGIKR